MWIFCLMYLIKTLSDRLLKDVDRQKGQATTVL